MSFFFDQIGYSTSPPPHSPTRGWRSHALPTAEGDDAQQLGVSTRTPPPENRRGLPIRILDPKPTIKTTFNTYSEPAEGSGSILSSPARTSSYDDHKAMQIARFASRTIDRIIRAISQLRKSMNENLHNEDILVRETHMSLDEAERILLEISETFTSSVEGNLGWSSIVEKPLALLREVMHKLDVDVYQFKRHLANPQIILSQLMLDKTSRQKPKPGRVKDTAEAAQHFTDEMDKAREEYEIANIPLQQYQDLLKKDAELFEIKASMQPPRLSSSAQMIENTKSPVSLLDTRVRHLSEMYHLPSQEYKDVPGSYIKRHNYYQSHRVASSGMWLIKDNQFEEWRSSPSTNLLWCWGPHGTGKSTLSSRVIDSLERNKFRYAYHYLGSGHVQSAAGVVLALLEQLCVQTQTFPSHLNHDDSDYLTRNLTSSKDRHDVNDTLNIHNSRERPRLILERANSSAIDDDYPHENYVSIPYQAHDDFGEIHETEFVSNAATPGPSHSEYNTSIPTQTNDYTSGYQENNFYEIAESLQSTDLSVESRDEEINTPLPPPSGHGSVATQVQGFFTRSMSQGSFSQMTSDLHSSYRAPYSESLAQRVSDYSTQSYYARSDAVGNEENRFHDYTTPVSHENRPTLSSLLDALREVCQSVISEPHLINPELQLFVVLDAWDELNMDSPTEFGQVLQILLENYCKVFISSTSPLQQSYIPPDNTTIEMAIEKYQDISDVKNYVHKTLQGHRPSLSGREVATATQRIMDASLAMIGLAKINTLTVTRALSVDQDGLHSILRDMPRPEPHTTNLMSRDTIYLDPQSNVLFGNAPSRTALADRSRFPSPGRNSLKSHTSVRKSTFGERPGEIVHLEPGEIIKWGLVHLECQDDFSVTLSKGTIIWLLASKFPLSWRALQAFLPKFARYLSLSSGMVEDNYGDYEGIISLCDPFLTIDPGNSLVEATGQLRSVENLVYDLWSDWTLKTFLAISETSLDLLLLPEFGHLCQTEEALIARIQDYPFLSHAAQWAHYARKLDQDQSQEQPIGLQLFLQSNLSSWIQVYFYTTQELVKLGLSFHAFLDWIISLTPLHVAARMGLKNIVLHLLDKDSLAIQKQDRRMSTALHEAAKAGFPDVVEVLLLEKLDIDAPDIVHKTPLVYAFEYGHPEILIKLFEAQFRQRQEVHVGDDIFLAYCQACSKITKEGLEYQAKQAALLSAVSRSDERSARLAMFSLEHGVNPNCQISNGESALHLATRSGRADVVRKLLRFGADINAKDNRGRNALFTALECEDEEARELIIELLVNGGASIDQADNYGTRIVHVAAEKGLIQTLRFFLFLSHDENPRDYAGLGLLDYARTGRHAETEEFLLSSMGSLSI